MRCPNHSQADTIGYCSVCGAFGCSECLTKHEQNWYCVRHYQPIAQQLEKARRHDEVRKKHPRQLLAVRYADGRCLLGVSFALNLRDTGFHLDVVDKSGVPLGKTESVRFQELKAVYFLKSLDGRFDRNVQYKDWVSEGGEVVSKFRDGDIVRGALRHRDDPDEARFHVVPADPASNNITILLERSAVEAMYTPEEYKTRVDEERQALRHSEVVAPVSQEEGMGDFYFETRDYGAALEQYRLASAKAPQLARLHKKLALAQYNVGVQFIKRHEYEKALACMESVVKIDPRNERAAKKVSQLNHIIKKEA